MNNNLFPLSNLQHFFISSQDIILKTWIYSTTTKKILSLHAIVANDFLEDYSQGLFEYFINMLSMTVEIENNPFMKSFLSYFQYREMSVDSLFELCTNFRGVIVNCIYENNLDSREVLKEVFSIFDKNFKLILKYYTDMIFQKELDINRNLKLLSEYKKALDESALIFKTDLSGKITYINDKLLEFSGYESVEVIGQKLNNMIYNDISNGKIEHIYKELKHKHMYKGIIKAYKKNRDYFYVDVTIVKINDIRHSLTEYMVIANDVTKLIDARIDALKAAKAKEYFLSNMSHEIRTPLNAILGFVNLLIDENLSKKHRNYLEIILNSGENLLSIINDILDFSKLRSGEFAIEPTIFSIHDELSHAMELFVASATAKNITITSFIDPEIPRELFADALRIKQIVSNLLSNAIKFTPKNGIIHVESLCDEKRLFISVKDNGIGIPQKDIQNIFSAFTQSRQNRAIKNDGTGLGLSICSQLVHHMNGTIHVDSKVGVGSIFSVEIPIEFNTEQCKLFDDIKEFQELKMVLYAKDKKILFQHESFMKYADAFKMNLTIVENFDCEFDIALFVHEDISEEFKQNVLNTNKKYIALMSKLYDDYERYPNITALCFPIYCSKLHSIFSEVVHTIGYTLDNSKEIQQFEGHILVAEDNQANQELIKAILTKYGLSFTIASHGLEAFELYKINSYDLILMDEQMAIMDGKEAAKKILKYEKENNLPHTPISALTANVLSIKEMNNVTIGIYDTFLTKPIILKELENIFVRFLKVASKSMSHFVDADTLRTKNVKGLDMQKLRKELLLSDDEILFLIELFIKKMKVTLPNLKSVIEQNEYEKIAFIAHSIKGSCANFRVEVLQKYTSEMESMALKKSAEYNYLESYNQIEVQIQEIQIVYPSSI